MNMRMAKVAILCEKKTAERKWSYGINVFENYIGEILSHEGIPHVWIDEIAQLSNDSVDVVIVTVDDDLKATAEQLRSFAEHGGTVISYAGLPKMAAQLNCIQIPAKAVGYTYLPAELGQTRPLRSFNIAPWIPAAQDGPHELRTVGSVRIDRPDGEETYTALQKFTVGKGSVERWSINIPHTIVTLQQGTHPVLADGIPAPDGSAKLDEDILKGDDAMGLDWVQDRLQTETGQPYFAHPYADFWREACVSHLLQTVVSKGLTLPFMGKWPEGISHVATISHDSDGNQDIHAESTLSLLAECEVRSTWCMLEPGYSKGIYEQVSGAGHELAFHYNSVVHEGKVWSEETFDRQHQWYKDATGEPHAYSNKNHYTRFEGWGELFSWSEKNKIQSDQTRGPSKPGNVGFLFGTCQPYFPLAWANEKNRMYNVVEISFLTQDMNLSSWADDSVITPFLEQVQLVDGGVAHFLFHQTHIHNREEVRGAFRLMVRTAKEKGFEFWTAKEINDWTRARRAAVITGMDTNGAIELKGQLPEGLPIYAPVTDAQGIDVIHRYGVPCVKIN